MKRGLFITAILALLIGVTAISRQTAEAEPAAPMDMPQWELNPPAPGRHISTNTPSGASLPTVVYSANGSRLMLVYEAQTSSQDTDKDIYYSVSTNNGATWSTPQPVNATPGTVSKESTVAFVGETARVVWVERNNATNVERLVTAAEPFPPFTILADTSTVPSTGIFSPDIAVRNNQVHIVWSQGLPENIRHTWSNNGGQSWQSTSFIPFGLSSFEPDVAIDETGKIHVVWKGQQSNVLAQVYYAQGTIQAGPPPSVNWSAPLLISTGVSNASSANIVIKDNQLQVSFTRRGATGNDQSILYTQCSSNCTNAGGWSLPQAISGPPVGANANSPYYVISDMVYDAGTKATYIYFHGTIPPGTNEVIRGVNSCDAWGLSVYNIDFVTEAGYQSLQPSITIHNKSIQLAYQLNAAGSNVPQIYHRRGTVDCRLRLYLPTIRRN